MHSTRCAHFLVGGLAAWLIVVVGGGAGLVGCSAPPRDGSLGEAAGTAFANDQAAYDFFVGKGLANFQAAGIVGNLDQESGVDPASVQYGGGPGRGIAQWSVGGRWDTSANDNVLWYASKQGESSGSLNLQLEFIWYELTSIGYGYSQLKASTNVTAATVTFMADYEICGTCDQTQRVAYAQSVLSAYGAPPSYAATFVSQTWPYASQPAFKLKCGEEIAASIIMKNAGAKSWDGSTRLGTTQPRDRSSIFVASDWLAPNRAAAPVTNGGSVAPGSDGTFAFTFHGPTGSACAPGTYKEFFGFVQEGVAWFSDSGQGGPPDDQIEALIQLVPGDPAPPGDMANAPTAAGDGGVGGDAGTTSDGSDGGASSGGNNGNGNGVDGATPPATSATHGCSIGGNSDGSGLALILLFILLAARRTIVPCPFPRPSWTTRARSWPRRRRSSID